MEYYSFDQRVLQSSILLNKYPDRIPLVIENLNEINLNEINKINKINKKYLLPKDLPFGSFFNIIKAKIKLDRKQAIFMFVKNGENYILIPISQTINDIYKTYKNDDGFLYIKFGIENTFG